MDRAAIFFGDVLAVILGRSDEPSDDERPGIGKPLGIGDGEGNVKMMLRGGGKKEVGRNPSYQHSDKTINIVDSKKESHQHSEKAK